MAKQQNGVSSDRLQKPPESAMQAGQPRILDTALQGSVVDLQPTQAPQPAWQNTNTVFTNEKAGMSGVDKDRVKQIVYEMSKDSPHFKNEQRKQAQTEVRLRKMKEKAKALTAQELAGHTRAMDAKVTALLASRDLTRTWIVVDLDAFFAAVEERDDPSLKTKPMGVGGIGMLSTANYVARKYGVRSAMPGFIAKRLCPELVFVKPNFAKYKEASDTTRVIFRDYDPQMQSTSMDEAYLDVTDFCSRHRITGEEVAAQMRARVREETGLTCSCGVAANAMLAKVCSDINKPDGQYVLPADPERIAHFLHTLPIRKVNGIGKVAEQILTALGVKTCSDLIAKRGLLSALYSEVAMDNYLEYGLGLGHTVHGEPRKEGEVGRKGISVERTFEPIGSKADLEAKCCALSEKLAEEMADEDLHGKTLTLKLKCPNFEVRTRAVTLGQHISSAADIQAAALRLLRAEMPIEVRLMGVRMSGFLEVRTPPGQRSLARFVTRRAENGAVGDKASEGDGAPEGGSSLPIELSLRDWQQPGISDNAGGEDDQQLQEASGEHRPGCQKDGEDGRLAKHWDCKVCTFAQNPMHLLRCEVCDQRRGSLPESLNTTAQAHMQNLSAAHPDPSSRVDQDSAQMPNLAPESLSLKLQAESKQIRERDAGSSGAQAAILQQAEGMLPSAAIEQAASEADGKGQKRVRAQESMEERKQTSGETRIPRCRAAEASEVVIAAGAAGREWLCPECGAHMDGLAQSEHEDYHFALRLQQMEGQRQGKPSLQPVGARQGRGRGAPKKSHRASNPSITAFLKPKHSM